MNGKNNAGVLPSTCINSQKVWQHRQQSTASPAGAVLISWFNSWRIRCAAWTHHAWTACWPRGTRTVVVSRSTWGGGSNSPTESCEDVKEKDWLPIKNDMCPLENCGPTSVLKIFPDLYPSCGSRFLPSIQGMFLIAFQFRHPFSLVKAGALSTNSQVKSASLCQEFLLMSWGSLTCFPSDTGPFCWPIKTSLRTAATR